jgi:hypothetical protein
MFLEPKSSLKSQISIVIVIYKYVLRILGEGT